MATPKKKISRSRRDKRRYGGGKSIENAEFYRTEGGELMRSHTISKDYFNCAVYEKRIAAKKK